MDTRHFVIIECRHLAKGCGLKCGCIGLMLFRNLLELGQMVSISKYHDTIQYRYQTLKVSMYRNIYGSLSL